MSYYNTLTAGSRRPVSVLLIPIFYFLTTTGVNPIARIVKSMSVVDKREPDAEVIRAQAEARLVADKVLKGNVLGGFGITFPGDAPITRNSLLDEINGLIIQSEEEKAVLDEIKKEIVKAREEQRREIEEYEREKASREDEMDAGILEDEVYNQRVAELTAMMEQARRESAEMSAQLEREAKELRERAREEGHGEGYEDGYNDGTERAQASFKQEAEPRLAELAGLFTSLSDYGAELRKKREKEFVELALAVAEKVVAKELKTKPETIISMLNEFVSRNQRETYINISVSPDVLPARAKACEELLEQIEGMNGSIVVYVEKDAPEGTLVLETPKGVTDMSIPTQFSNIRESLEEAGLEE